MSLIDLEKNKLNEWAKKNSKNSSFFSNSGEDTYYSISKDEEVVYEFYYENIPQLKKMMEEKKEIVHDTQIDLVCSVAAFKYKSSVVKVDAKPNIEKEHNEMIPDFIYNF